MEELKRKEEKNRSEGEEKMASRDKKAQAEEEEKKKEDEADQLNREKEELVQRVKELEEYAKHLKARFDNYVLQAQKDRERILKTSNEYLITRILPVLENFERALAHAENAKPDTMLKGVQMIYNQLKRILEDEGLSEIFPKVGDEFDPYYHEAVESVETQDYKEHSIVEMLEKGYKLNARVLKPAKVKVAVAPKHPPDNTREGDD